jgi:Na+-driven multidrug efflux pump
MLSMWLFRVILGYILGITLGWGILGIWIAMDCEWAVRGLIFMKRFRGNKWLQHRVI